MHYFAEAGRPIVWVMTRASDLVLFLLGSRHEDDESSIGLEDIEHLIRTGAEKGLIDPAEQNVALGALRSANVPMREIMRPRVEIDADSTWTRPPRSVRSRGHVGLFTRAGVRGGLGPYSGIRLHQGRAACHYLAVPIDVRKMLHPAIRVPDTMPVDRLLAEFQKRHGQMAIVLNETRDRGASHDEGGRR